MPRPMKPDRRNVQFTLKVEVPIGMTNLRARALLDEILKDGHALASEPREGTPVAHAADLAEIRVKRVYTVPKPRPRQLVDTSPGRKF